jgi:ribonuclease HI
VSEHGPVARRLRDELTRLERDLAAGGFLVSAVQVIDEGRWGRLDAAVEGQSSGGKIQIHLSTKGAVSVVPQGAAATDIANALGLSASPRAASAASTPSRPRQVREAAPVIATRGAAVNASTNAGAPASAVPARTAPDRALSAPPDPSAPVIVDCSKFGQHLIGPTEWRGVQRTRSGAFVEVFRSARHERGHNNLGELLAIIDACDRIADGRLSCSGIRSDSRTAISWFTKRLIKTTLSVDEVCDPAFAAAVRRAQAWLRSPARDACRVSVTLWDTRREGENPADFGRK